MRTVTTTKCFAVLTLTTLLLSCEEFKNSSSNQDRVLVLATSAEYPPFEFRKDSKIVGFDIDLAEELAQRLGYTLKILDMEFNAVIPALQSGQADFVMAGMTVTDERKNNVDFTGVYYHNSFALIARKGTKFSSDKDLLGKKLGVQLGSTMEKLGKQKSKENGNLQLVSLGSNSILIEELKAERLDAVVMERVQAQAFSKFHPSLHHFALPEWGPSLAEGYAIAFPKNPKLLGKDEKLRAQFDQVLNQLKQEGKMSQITEKWLGTHHD